MKDTIMPIAKFLCESSSRKDYIGVEMVEHFPIIQMLQILLCLKLQLEGIRLRCLMDVIDESFVAIYQCLLNNKINYTYVEDRFANNKNLETIFGQGKILRYR